MVCVYDVCLCVLVSCHGMYTYRNQRIALWSQVLSFHHYLGSGHGAQVTRFAQPVLLLLSILPALIAVYLEGGLPESFLILVTSQHRIENHGLNKDLEFLLTEMATNQRRWFGELALSDLIYCDLQPFICFVMGSPVLPKLVFISYSKLNLFQSSKYLELPVCSMVFIVVVHAHEYVVVYTCTHGCGRAGSWVSSFVSMRYCLETMSLTEPETCPLGEL